MSAFNLQKSDNMSNSHLITKDDFIDYLNEMFDVSATGMDKNEYLNKSISELITMMMDKNNSDIHDEELSKMLAALFLDIQYTDFCFSPKNVKTYGAMGRKVIK